MHHRSAVISYGNKASAANSWAFAPVNFEPIDWVWQRGRSPKGKKVPKSFNKIICNIQKDTLNHLTEVKMHYACTCGKTSENPGSRETVQKYI